MNETFYYVKQINGDYLFDNFPNELKYLISQNNDSREVITINFDNQLRKARIGVSNNEQIKIIVITFEEKYVKRLKFFKDLIDSSLIFINPLLHLQNNVEKTHKDRFDDFVHNVTSLNSYSIQNLFALIPQDLLSDNINTQKDVIKDIIKEQPNRTVDTLLKEIKYSIATKVEFSVFDNLQQGKSIFHKQQHKIRNVILSILQIFIEDFDDKKIEVTLSASDKMVEIDFDSIFVSLYFIFDNAIKYCCPNTKFKIILSEESDSFDIIFRMVSIQIKELEKNLLMERGYRSGAAKKMNEKGSGIGMFRILKTLKLNNAELEVNPRAFEYSKTLKDIIYEGNEFRIKFKNQNNWFN